VFDLAQFFLFRRDGPLTPGNQFVGLLSSDAPRLIFGNGFYGFVDRSFIEPYLVAQVASLFL
jgi:hypothetical protein